MKTVIFIAIPLTTSLVTAYTFVFVNKANEILISFAPDIPTITQITMQYYPVVMIVPISTYLVSFLAFKHQANSSSLIKINYILLAMSVLSFLLVWLLLSAPCFDCNITVI